MIQIRAKKRLGQNFLVDRNIAAKIILACEFCANDEVLEIGAGYGAITCQIAPQVKRITAVEFDSELFSLLSREAECVKNIRPVEGDILKFDMEGYYRDISTGIKVVGNIPYYISSPIIEYLMCFARKIDTVYLTVQKEYAERLVSAPGTRKYGSLSCFVQYYTLPSILFKISKNCFRPQPKVDSAFLKLQVLKKPAVRPADESLFFRVIRKSFNQRRKTLRSSLQDMISAGSLSRFLESSGLSVNARPEQLGIAEFAALSDLIAAERS